MRKVTKEESMELFARLKKADESNMLQSILKSAMAFNNSSFLVVMEIMNNLKDGLDFKVDQNIFYLIKRDLEEWENKETNFPEDIIVTVKGFEKIEEAKEFCNWYSGQGESDAEIWFDCRASEGVINTTSMLEQSIMEIDNKNVEMILKMYK